MTNHLFVVFTNAVDGREVEFNEWYDQHLEDVLQLEGFISAQRFRLSETEPGQEAPFSYLALYEVDTDDIRATRAALRDAAGTEAMPFSDALEEERCSWYYQPLGARREAVS